jgi:hypothetical protein
MPFGRHSRRCVRQPERAPDASRLRPSLRRAFTALGLLLLSCFGMTFTRAEERLRIQGLSDAEVWNTDPDFSRLTRNEGETAPLGRLRLWAIGDFMKGLQGFVLGEVEGGSGTDDGEKDTELRQAYLRYSFSAPKRLILQAGKLTLPYGNFSRRYFSNANPLIGNPLNYEISYPLGIQLSGAISRFDFMAAALDGPLTRQDYDSEPESSVRPALAAGVTPATGLRIGGYYTQGEYLEKIAQWWLLPGDQIGDFHEKVVGLDFQFSRAHFELNAEMTQSRLEVPYAGDARGRAYYAEPKYTFSPRWYGALRYERGDLPEAHWMFATVWSAEQRRVHDVEAGIGFRITPGLLVKASYRTEIDRGDGTGELEGHAAALQFSYTFDLNSWFERPH